MKLNIRLFLINDDKLLEKYNNTRDKVYYNSIKKGFHGEQVFNKKYLLK